jgi:hypothetical protein
MRYLRTLRDTLSMKFWGVEAAVAIVFVVGRLTDTVLVSAAALVAGTALALFGIFVATLSFRREVRGTTPTIPDTGAGDLSVPRDAPEE